MRKIERIILHCSVSWFGDVLLIDQWHRERGFDKGIGYQYVILNGYQHSFSTTRIIPLNGAISPGRALERMGAHAKGFNRGSIGICIIGEPGCFTRSQLEATRKLILYHQHKFSIPLSEVLGHYEVDPKKTCPGLPMDDFRAYVQDGILLDSIYTNPLTVEKG